MKTKIYKDKRGWLFQVSNFESLLSWGRTGFKAQYKKPDDKDGSSWHYAAWLPWRDTEEEARADLDDYAAKKGMKLVRV